MSKFEISSEKIRTYASSYDEGSFLSKVAGVFGKVGAEVIYKALQLFFVLRKEDTPAWVKAEICGALAYFVLPIDLIPDFIPVVGFVDDIAVIGLAFASCLVYIDDEVRRQAKELMLRYFDLETVEAL